MYDELLTQLTNELGLTKDEDKAILKGKFDNAVRTVKLARNYQAKHTQEFIEADIQKFASNIYELALYDYNQIGAEGQTSHNENGTNRTWKKRNECLSGIVPFAKTW